MILNISRVKETREVKSKQHIFVEAQACSNNTNNSTILTRNCCVLRKSCSGTDAKSTTRLTSNGLSLSLNSGWHDVRFWRFGVPAVAVWALNSWSWSWAFQRPLDHCCVGLFDFVFQDLDLGNMRRIHIELGYHRIWNPKFDRQAVKKHNTIK